MRWLAVMCAAALAVLLAACTPAINGLTGISVDRQGHLVIVLGWCGRASPERAVITHDGVDPLRGTDYVVDASYQAPRLSGQLASFRADDPRDGWRLEGSAPSFQKDITYSAGSGGRRFPGYYSTGDVEFRLSTVARLAPGQVFIQDPREEGLPERMVTMREFVGIVHDSC